MSDNLMNDRGRNWDMEARVAGAGRWCGGHLM